MVVQYLYIFNILILYSHGVCIHLLKYKATTDVTANCNDASFTVDMKRHNVEWGTFNQLFEDKYPYIFLTNGSLLIKAVSDSSSHYLCDVKDRVTNVSLHRCGTSVTIIKPLILKFTPINETVERGTQYKINCHGGGGDFNDWKLMYLVNDVQVSSDSAFPINSDTKVECRLVSENESLSSVAFIKVKKDGVLTDEEKLLQTMCSPLFDGLCSKKLPDKSYRIYSSYSPSRGTVEKLLMELFQVLDNKIIAEHNEDKCVDRFERLMCATLYSPCHTNHDNNVVTASVCRESCYVTLETVCRNTIQRIKKLFDNVIRQFTDFNDKSDDFSVPDYKRRFVARVLLRAQSVFNCEQLQSFRNRTREENCSLLNLDAIAGPNSQTEEPSSKCFNGVGRNFTGEVSLTVGNTKCIEWRRVPQLYIGFHQQNLQNQSSYCRNPGAIFNSPVCPVTTINSGHILRLHEIKLLPCSQIYSCEFWIVLKKSGIEKGSIGTIVIVSFVFFALFAAILIVYARCVHKRLKQSKKKTAVYDEIPLHDDQTQLFHNKAYMYKNVQNGHYSCPIYNSACLERVFKLSDGAYGEILLVQAVFEDSTPLISDESPFSTVEKGPFGIKSFIESDDNSIDDFILSKDKTFNGKPCWPFDKTSGSGCCSFAIIKYSIRSSDQTMESRFAQETKILSSFNHSNIMRFYGVTVNSTGKIISRIVEYLPNGTLYSILIGDRPKPVTLGNQERNKVDHGYQTVNALLKNRTKENNSLSTTESRQLKRKKTISVQSKELEPPRPTEHIDLNNKQLVKWTMEICDAVMYLHSKHLLHRDIATRNCLVALNLETKLSDFNYVQKFTIGHDLIGSKHEFIPIRWLPKETLESLMFNIDSDVWMFGVFMWEVMSLGKQPYDNLDLNQTCEAIITGLLLSIPENCPDDMYEQMKLCWLEPNARPCLETVLKNLKKIFEML